MRLDRFITLNLMQPLRRLRTTHLASRISALPVLMYHSISDDPEPGVRPYYRVCTSPRRFREQMQWLKDNGCCGVTLSAGLAWLDAAGQKQKIENGKQKAEIGSRQCQPSDLRPPTSDLRPVAITFDDGFRNFYTEAFPALQRQGFTATMFLATAFISQPRRRFKDTECLTWDEVRELGKAGMEFGSHTVNHPKLVELSLAEVKLEIQNSKFEIEAHLGVRCAAFAYPFAFPQSDRAFRQSFRNLLTGAGYDCCVTTEIGRVKPGDDPYCLKRLPVNSLDDAALFRAKLAGDYDWLARPQKLIKQFKRRILGSGKGKTGSTQTARSDEPALGSRTSDL